jgi:sugar transferase (PEP-CTERM system associated)
MKLFGNYLDSRTVTYAGLDALVFYFPVAWLSFRPACPGCADMAEIALEPYQLAAIPMLLLLLGAALGLYNSDAAHDLRTYLKRLLVSWQLIAVMAILLLALGSLAAGWRLGHSGLLAVAAIVLVMGVQGALRVVLAWWLERPSQRRRVLVVGDTAAAEKLAQYLQGPGLHRFQHLRTVEARQPRPQPTRIGALLVAGAPAEAPSLPDLAVSLRADQIVVACEDRGALPMDELLECKLRGIDVAEAPDFWERETGVVELARDGAAWLALSEGITLSRGRLRIKRAVDVLASFALIVTAAPLCLAVALAIRLESPGPIFYRQERVGLNGRIFRVWKFRSMRVDAESDGAPRWAANADDRTTRVGRFIRKVRIDEIPQVLNVLAGEMSFIGPRPERPFFVEQLREQIAFYDLRHRLAPGITGWAQVNYPYGASVEDARRKLAYDLYYLKRSNLFLDMLILLQTVRVVLFAHGAR